MSKHETQNASHETAAATSPGKDELTEQQLAAVNAGIIIIGGVTAFNFQAQPQYLLPAVQTY
jgi:hypothetical protein